MGNFCKVLTHLLCTVLLTVSVPSYACALRPTAYRISNGEPSPGSYSNTHKTSSAGVAGFLEQADDIGKIIKSAYRGKVFTSGETYLEHVKKVAGTLLELDPNIDQLALSAALLHKIPISELRGLLKRTSGLSKKQQARILELVERMNAVSRLPYMPPHKANFAIQNQMNMIVQMAAEPEVMLLVFADKLQIFMSALESERDYIYREITHIYAPLAERLGLDYWAGVFRDKALKLNRPDAYYQIKSQIEERLGMSYEEAKIYLQEITRKVNDSLTGRGINAGISSRVKRVYSVYEKIESRGFAGMENIDDFFGIRAVFSCESDLWQAVDIPLLFGRDIEGQYELKREEKVGFEILQRGIKDDLGIHYEFQFMTNDNYDKYKHGIAAHWLYKLKRETGQDFDTDEIQIVGNFNRDFMALKESLNKWVFIFMQMEETGKVTMKPLRLPAGSIPADFAALKSINALNNDYRGAAVYRKEYDADKGALLVLSKMMRNERYQLQPGELVDILIQKDFLLKSSKTKDNIRRNAQTLRARLFLNNLNPAEMHEAGEKGKAMLAKAGFSFHISAIGDFFYPLAVSLGLKDEAELYAALVLTDKLTVRHVKGHARIRGMQLLKERRLDLYNNVILGKLNLILHELSMASLDELFIAIGSGRIDDKLVYGKLSASRPIKIIDISNSIKRSA